ncbi:glycosyltransferase [Mycobacterium intracellulare]|uniref:glycosyltransferase n=1 Tax=Mycobacterium intracellulare TaxID=1767 RepID=UPI00080B6610|nr:glycosyltransferase [Mycobacterium intracellulare]OCB18788.1 sugar transferase [Mycobacterium intracellulare subsp. yongonense]
MSVVSITYNHERYVREALDGFVAQKIDFSVEVIVADDASTDATPAIVREYADRYPHLFRPILRSHNVGIHANATDALSAARGEYLAICEGDDYWIDPMKLSKQVAFLDAHPNTSLCFHPVQVVWTDGRKESEFPPLGWRRDLSVDALIRRNFIQTNSVLYRRQARYDDIPADVMPMDWYLHVRHAAHGGIAMLPETMAVYRRHPQSFWYGADANSAKFWASHGRGHAAMFEAMLDVFPGDPEREGIIARQTDWILREIAKVPGPEGRAALLDTVAHHPRSAMLALQYRSRSPMRRLRALWRRLPPTQDAGKRSA